MTPWIIEIEGDRFDIEELFSLNNLSDFNICEEAGRFYFRAEEFNACTTAREVFDRAKEFINTLNGIGQTEIENWQNIKLKGVAKDEPNGKPIQYLFAETITGRARVRAGGLSVMNADGSIQSAQPSNIFQLALNKSKKNPDVKRALRLFGSREITWTKLYNIYEIVQKDVGGKEEILKRGWAKRNQVDNFKHTANSAEAIGDDARHGKANTPPSKPMLLSDAQSLIGNLLQKWLGGMNVK